MLAGGPLPSELQRCDEIAPPHRRSAPEFRRLIDDATASLAQVSQAVEQRDARLLGRLIDELRAFDRLLAFRFGLTLPSEACGPAPRDL